MDLRPDWRVLGFTAGLAVLTCVLFGLAPALRATRASPGAVLKSAGRGMTASRERFGLRRMLVVSQVALSLVLLVGALLFVRSLRKLLTLDAGFHQDGILITQMDLTRSAFAKERRQPFKRDLIMRMQAIPGVDAAANTTIIPISGNGWNQHIWINGQSKGNSWLAPRSPGYFKTLGTPLLAGRDFDEHDTLTSPKVAIVNQSSRANIWAAAIPSVRHFSLEQGPGEPDPLYQVVGEVKDTKYGELREEQRPIASSPRRRMRPDQGAQILVRSSRRWRVCRRGEAGYCGSQPGDRHRFPEYSRRRFRSRCCESA